MRDSNAGTTSTTWPPVPRHRYQTIRLLIILATLLAAAMFIPTCLPIEAVHAHAR